MSALRSNANLRATRAAALTAAAVVLANCSPSGGSRGGGDPNATPVTTFSKSYGGPGDDIATDVIQTADGGIAFVGAVNSEIAHGRPERGDVWFSKLDANGNVLVQRAIGDRPLAPAGAFASVKAVRPTRDGGYVLIGTVSSKVADQDILDILVSKLDASGVIEWTRSYDSGPWINYEYAATPTVGAAATDIGEDIREMPDGGFVLAAASEGNLRDTRGIGFEGGDNGTSSVFLNAQSVVFARLRADGELLSLRRLTDGQFMHVSTVKYFGQHPRVQPTTDGGALLVYYRAFGPDFDRGLEAVRLLSDGSNLWRTRIAASGVASAIIQTDDADDPDTGIRDGVADDGFLVATSIGGSFTKELAKLSRDGSTQWHNEYDAVNFRALVQRCSQTAPIGCIFAAAGESDDDEDSRTEATAYALTLDSQGVELLEARLGPGSIRDLATRAGNDGFRLLTSARSNELRLVDVDINLEGIGSTATLAAADSRLDSLAFTSNAQIAAFSKNTDGVLDRGVHFDAQLSELNRIVISAGNPGDFAATRTEVAFALTEVAPESFIIGGHSQRAGDAAEGGGGSDAWLLRFDTAGERVVWQRRLSPGRSGRIRSLARVSDGVLVGGRVDGAERVIKVDGNGRTLWQSMALAGRAQLGLVDSDDLVLRAVRALPGGESVALLASADTRNGPGLATELTSLARLGATGQVLWERHQAFQGITVSDVQPTTDGGFALAGPLVPGAQPPQPLTVIKLDARGDTQWGRNYRLGTSGSLSDTRIVQTPDGGYLLGATEAGAASTGANNLPVGQRNVLLVRVDRDGNVIWGRVYGALYDERIHSLANVSGGGFIVAGESTSLGDRTEAWLLKLGPDGLIAPSGCNAFLGRLPAAAFIVEATAHALSLQSILAPQDTSPTLPTAETQSQSSALPEQVTARQCLGEASNTVDPPPPAPIASFALSVDFTGAGQGSIASQPPGLGCSADCSVDFPDRTVVTLTATAADGSHLARWEGCGDTDGDRCYLLMNRAHAVSVRFEPRVVRISVERGTDGTGRGDVTSSPAGINCGGDCIGDFPFNTSVTLTAAPRDNSSFEGWAGCDESTGLVCTVLANASRRVTAQFTRPRPDGSTLIVTRIGSGSVLSEPAGIDCGGDCSETYAAGTTVLLAATAAPGFRVVGWSGDADCADGTVTMTVDTACRITFEAVPPPEQATLTVQKLGVNAMFGFIVSAPAGIDCGSTCSVTFASGLTVRLEVDRTRTDSQFGGWMGCDRVIAAPGGLPSQCEVDLNSSRTVQAAFPTF